MKKLVVVLLVAAAAGVIGIVWLAPRGNDAGDREPATEVAVRVGKVVRTTLRAYVTAYGVVEPEPAGERPAANANVAPAVPGVVVAVRSVEGQHVAKGDVMFQLDSRAADVAADFAAKALERERQLIGIQGTSEKALQDAEQRLDAARVQQALLKVQAPLAGTVVRVDVKPGEAVDLTTVMASVVDLDRLVVGASVPAAEVRAMKVGQAAEVLVEGGTAPVGGTVEFISPEVDPRTGTAQVRVKLPGGSGLRPGQFVTARIVSEEHTDRLAVPVASVVKNEQGASVIAVVQGDTATQKPVKTGLRDRELIEIEADGLMPDMTVVTEGAYALPAATKVRVLGN
ncbi:MAG TPA: efflux RND transporter periplasmic adaptor subunit [Gammaproteobacteria bacterium]|nr:efflux RND transporter periplasmic adaptor subunit [Gammaproteobacteria bacterium]